MDEVTKSLWGEPGHLLSGLFVVFAQRQREIFGYFSPKTLNRTW